PGMLAPPAAPGAPPVNLGVTVPVPAPPPVSQGAAPVPPQGQGTSGAAVPPGNLSSAVPPAVNTATYAAGAPPQAGKPASGRRPRGAASECDDLDRQPADARRSWKGVRPMEVLPQELSSLDGSEEPSKATIFRAWGIHLLAIALVVLFGAGCVGTDAFLGP